MHFSCTSRVPGGRPRPGCSRPVRRPAAAARLCDASPGTRPARLRPVPADSITVQLADPRPWPAWARSRAGRPSAWRADELSWPARDHGNPPQVHQRCMAGICGMVMRAAGHFPVREQAAKGWLISRPGGYCRGSAKMSFTRSLVVIWRSDSPVLWCGEVDISFIGRSCWNRSGVIARHQCGRGRARSPNGGSPAPGVSVWSVPGGLALREPALAVGYIGERGFLSVI